MKLLPVVLLGIAVSFSALASETLNSQRVGQLAEDLDEATGRHQLRRMIPQLALMFQLEEEWFARELKERKYQVSDFVFSKLISAKSGKPVREFMKAHDRKTDWLPLLQEHQFTHAELSDIFLKIQAEIVFLRYDEIGTPGSKSILPQSPNIVWSDRK